ncbi:MAG TPA: hypothetical protein VI434_15715 [Candidatus Dormibacteraeota bacterium]
MPSVSNLFRRGKQEDVAATVAATATACSMRRCTNMTAQPCAYRDRRERSCPTAFCAAHSVSVGGATYCRRHAGTVQAIGELAKNPSGLPDLLDRGPGLINWIARDLDKDIRTLLARTVRPGESVIVDDAVRLKHDHWRQARWERSWRIVEHTGPVLAVTVHMSEDDESRVHVRVGAEMVADSVPPWIARRSQGVEVEAAIDISQRQLFYQMLEENISAAIIRFRAREDSVAA